MFSAVVSPIPIKRRVRFTKQGKAYTDAATKADLARVRDSYHGAFYPASVPLALIIDVYQQLPKSRVRFVREPFLYKPDVDNVEKVVMDGLRGKAFDDDKQITITVTQKHDRNNDIEGEYIEYTLCESQLVKRAVLMLQKKLREI